MSIDVVAPAVSHSPLSTEVQVALSPDATYRRLRGDITSGAGGRTLRRVATVFLVIGTVAPMVAVDRVTFGLVVTTALSWSFALAIQMIIGACVIASAPRRSVRMADALDLWFAGHLPYSLWMLAGGVLVADTGIDPIVPMLAMALVPAVWTGAIVCAFCRRVLDVGVAGARWRAIGHYAVTWAIAFAYVAWASGGWFQVADGALRMVGR